MVWNKHRFNEMKKSDSVLVDKLKFEKCSINLRIYGKHESANIMVKIDAIYVDDLLIAVTTTWNLWVGRRVT